MTDSKSKILVTGGNGLIGSHIREIASGFNWTFSSKSENNVDSSMNDQFDLKDLDRIEDWLCRLDPEIIINAGGITAVGQAEEDHNYCHKVNVESVIRIAEWCKRNNRRLIQYSTDFVFDGSKSDLYSEFDAAKPVNYYGQTKLMGEEAVQISGCNHAIIRTSLVYGYASDLSRLNFPLFIIEKLSKGVSLEITADQFRTPTHALDLAEATIDLARSNYQGIYHLSGPDKINVYEFALKVCSEFGLNKDLLNAVKTTLNEGNSNRPLDSALNIAKAASDINYSPEGIESGLSSMHQRMLRI